MTPDTIELQEPDYNDLDALRAGEAPESSEEYDPIHLQVAVEDHKERLDRLIARLLPNWSRSRLQQWIRAAAVLVDNAPAASISQKVLAGQSITVLPQPSDEIKAFTPEDLPLNVVAETEHYLVINKAVGMVVHPANGNWSGTVLNALLHHWPQLRELPRAGIVHRLDKDTSGLMVVAKQPGAQLSLVRQLQAHTVQRQYCAVVWGSAPTNGTVDAEMARDPRNKLRMTVLEGGKAAVTHYDRLATGDLLNKTVSVVRCRLETGRTHQIRVHMESIGLPLVGDPTYRRGAYRGAGLIGRQALHATRLGFIDPHTGQDVSFFAPLPDDIVQLISPFAMPEEIYGRFAD